MNVVVDTSALLRLFIPDGPLPDGVEETLGAAEQGSAALLAPELALAEAGQVILKKVRLKIMTPAEGQGLLTDLLNVPLQTFGHRTLLPRAMELAHQCKITVYDALFLALAEEHATPLLTADDRLSRAARSLKLPAWGPGG